MLIKEAKKRFGDSTVVSLYENRVRGRSKGRLDYTYSICSIKDNDLFLGNKDLDNNRICVFEDGKWATIVEPKCNVETPPEYTEGCKEIRTEIQLQIDSIEKTQKTILKAIKRIDKALAK